MKLKTVQTEDVAAWWSRQRLADSRSNGLASLDAEFLKRLGIPVHLQLLSEHFAEHDLEESLASVSFYSLCRGLFLPLSSLQPSRIGRLFGLQAETPPGAEGREKLLVEFLEKPIGLSLTEKLGCLCCDPFFGRSSTFRQDRLLHLLRTFDLVGRRMLLDRLVQFGDVAALFAASRSSIRGEPPLTAAEVLRTIRLLPGQPLNRTFEILRSLIARCGKVEAYFLARLLLGKNGPGTGVSAQSICRALSQVFRIPLETVAHAAALTDVFQVGRVLSESGVDGLRQTRLQPLSPVRPSLASGTVDKVQRFPVWVERKYDGVRFLLHKATDTHGNVACAAFTRNGNDWLDLVPGLDEAIRLLPVHSLILDGELCGTWFNGSAPHQATVYEIVAALKRDELPVTLKFVAFDVLYFNGQDLTRRPLRERQIAVSNLMAMLVGLRLPFPLSMAEGQLAHNAADVSRLFHHFRRQGYEGIITKDLSAPYSIAARDPAWLKRKAEVTLDLVVLGATFAVGNRHAGAFGSYVLGVRTADGGFVEIGDVDGVGRLLDWEIQRQIMRDGLMTGRRIERKLTDGTRAGLELRPAIVVTVMFQEISREPDGRLTLRHPRIKLLRADKAAEDADSLDLISELFFRQRPNWGAAS